MSDRIVENWPAFAEYDLQTADAMLQARCFLYVAFTCQQAIEKILKAAYVKEKNETPPLHSQLGQVSR